jgi:hypothetical protein
LFFFFKTTLPVGCMGSVVPKPFLKEARHGIVYTYIGVGAAF